MQPPGIIGTLQLAAVLVFAIPLVLFGADQLLRGQPLGIAFIGLAVLMIILQHYLRNPFDIGDIVEVAIDGVKRNRD